MINLGFAITGSFCTHEKILEVLKTFDKEKYNVIPIISPSVETTDTRFGNHNDFLKNIEEITGNKIISTIGSAEPLGPKNIIDCLVIAPCTGNTLAKLANAITDTAVTMTAKSLSRNDKPVIIGISTNDGLGLNMKNIATLMQTKNYYFVPFGQDDCEKKPKSLICNWDKIEETVVSAMNQKQIQPILI